MPDVRTVLDSTRTHLAAYQAAMGAGPESDPATTAAWHLAHDLEALLPLVDDLLAAAANHDNDAALVASFNTELADTIAGTEQVLALGAQALARRAQRSTERATAA